jgi:hypothetical protein
MSTTSVSEVPKTGNSWPFIREQDYTFVTNNRTDFLALHGKEPLHAGVIIIVPNVTPALQRELFRAVLARPYRRTGSDQ